MGKKNLIFHSIEQWSVNEIVLKINDIDNQFNGIFFLVEFIRRMQTNGQTN